METDRIINPNQKSEMQPIPDYVNGCCPFISSSFAFVSPAPPPGIIGGNGPAIVNGTINAPCVGEKCQLFDESMDRCCLVSLPMLNTLIGEMAEFHAKKERE